MCIENSAQERYVPFSKHVYFVQIRMPGSNRHSHIYITHKTTIMVSLVMAKQFIWAMPSSTCLLTPN